MKINKLNIGTDLYLKGRIGWKGLNKGEYLLNGDYSIINATALMDGYINWNNCGFITKERYEESKEIMLQEKDILISKDGTLGKIGYVKNLTKPCTVASGVFVLRNTIPEKLNFDYLYHLLKSHIFKDFINKNKASGSTINHLYQKDLERFEIEIPDITIQNKISIILNKIDDKIELNNKISSELEAMAKTIYDYWFLQFEFPNEEGKPYKSSGGKMVWNEELKREIPEGWEVKSIFDELSVQYGFPFATDKFTDGKTDIPVVRIRDILTNTISTYSNENVDEKYRLNEQDLLIGMDGNFHMNYWIDNTSYLNQRSVRLRTKDTSNVSIIQVKYNIAPYIKAKEERAGGSTVGHLSDKDLKELKILVPKTKKLREILDNTLMKIVKNRKENQELTSLRDFLLPLLMNGQVGFKEE